MKAFITVIIDPSYTKNVLIRCRHWDYRFSDPGLWTQNSSYIGNTVFFNIIKKFGQQYAEISEKDIWHRLWLKEKRFKDNLLDKESWMIRIN